MLSLRIFAFCLPSGEATRDSLSFALNVTPPSFSPQKKTPPALHTLALASPPSSSPASALGSSAPPAAVDLSPTSIRPASHAPRCGRRGKIGPCLGWGRCKCRSRRQGSGVSGAEAAAEAAAVEEVEEEEEEGAVHPLRAAPSPLPPPPPRCCSSPRRPPTAATPAQARTPLTPKPALRTPRGGTETRRLVRRPSPPSRGPTWSWPSR